MADHPTPPPSQPPRWYPTPPAAPPPVPPPGPPPPPPANWGATPPPRRPTWLLPVVGGLCAAAGGLVVWWAMSDSPTASDRRTEVTDTSSDDTAGSDTTDAVTTTVAVPTTPAVVLPTTVAPPPTTVAPTVAPTTAAPTVPPATVPPATTAVSPGGVVFASRCQSPYGWNVGVPLGWYTGDAASGWECSMFDRVPVIVDDTTADLVRPIYVQATSDVSEDYALYGNSEAFEVLSYGEPTVGGVLAGRFELLTTDVGEIGAGVQVICYIIPTGATSGVTITGYAFTPAEYAEVTTLVDAMAGDLVSTV